jgi:hypothetical protein
LVVGVVVAGGVVAGLETGGGSILNTGGSVTVGRVIVVGVWVAAVVVGVVTEGVEFVVVVGLELVFIGVVA